MIKIGILGSDNSHALAFAKLCNIPDENGKYAYDDIRITAIYGRDDDPAHTKQVAEDGKIEFIAQKPEEFFGKVDAVMVVYRKGSYHVPEILPFINAGYPVWIDKPVCSSVEDIEKLRDAVIKNNALVTGGSTVKYAPQIVKLGEDINSDVYGKVMGVNFNFPGDLESQYDGIYFYGPHNVEMMMGALGYDVKSVNVTKLSKDRFTAVINYENCQAVLNYVPCRSYFVTVYGDKKTDSQPLDISTIYKDGFEKFAEMLHTKTLPLSFDDLVKPIYVLDAMDRSVKENRQVFMSEYSL